MHNPFSLEGKTILLTGASSGIGRATAVGCSKMGATCVIIGRNEERLNDTFVKLEGDGHMQIVGDLVDEQIIARIADETLSLDGVLLCAGVADTTIVKFYSKDKFQRVLDINLISPTILMRALLTKKKVNKGASIVFISSVGAKFVIPGLGLYAASKSAINLIMKSLALELAGRKIRANSILPGMVKSELFDTLTSITKEDLEADMQNYLLGYGEPTDVANAAIYLFSDASKWMTGTEIILDGGYLLK